ncbi:MAG: PHP domain-containing protein, partial [Rhodospirillaceae bacterium]
MTYADLDVTTNFSFLHGASHADELVVTAAALGHSAIAVTDRNTLAGVVRAFEAARKMGLRLVVGCRLDLLDAPSLLVYPTDRAAYGRLCKLLTLGRRRAPKGECHLDRADVADHAEGLIAMVLPPDEPGDEFTHEINTFKDIFKDRLYLAARCVLDGHDARRLDRLSALAEQSGVPLVATNGVRMHTPARRPLLDVLTCIREKVTVDTAGWRLAANAEAHLKSPADMARLFRDYPDAIARTQEIVAACTFSLDELRYEYPDEPVPAGATPQEELERLTWEGARRRWPDGVPPALDRQIRHEFTVVAELGYAPYFLTVHDIVRFARSRGILCQGRGSA